MRNHRSISKDKLAGGPAQALVVSGLAAGLVAASLTGIGTASATCIGFSGISIGDGCTTQLGTIAFALGPGTATALGFFTGAIAIGDSDALADGTVTAAWAGGTGSDASTDGTLNWAVAQGDGVSALAGIQGLDFSNFANFAFNFGNATDGAFSTVEAGGGAFNLAANLGGNATAVGAAGPVDIDIFAGDGSGNVALNVIGNRNLVYAHDGNLNIATNWGSLFSYPNGSDNEVTATGSGVASNTQSFLSQPCTVAQCGNTVTADGPLSIAIADGVVRKLVAAGPFEITLGNLTNSDDLPDNPNLAPDPAAAGTQGSLSRSALNAAFNNTKVPSFGGSARNGVSDRITKSTKSFNDSVKKFNDSVKKFNNDNVKKFNDTVKRVTGGFAKAAKATDAGGK